MYYIQYAYIGACRHGYNDFDFCCFATQAAWKSDDMIKPPDHITTNHIYSNVYRLGQTRDSLSLEGARDRARQAASGFRICGRVRRDWIGSFRAPK